MAFVHGKIAVFKVKSSADVLTDISAYCDSVEVNMSAETGETTTFGKENKTYVSGLTDWTVSVSGKWDATATSGPDAILNGIWGAETSKTFEAGPEGSAIGKVKYTGECWLTSYVVSAPVGGVVTFSADFQGSGVLTKTAF